ncbi:sugar/maltose fermentation stimulation protein [hydrocarbon metagenome]|uniref:Sugar/maltose fermentation stimulation protein n=1 Tax=hydrocarbon metagenome TaxID=938273 RepID=A0A0W8E723_9ZZZZ
MKYKDIKRAKFLSRPNRFIAHIEVEGRPDVCNVKNTGRCRELLMPGADIVIQEVNHPKRKTKYDLIAVYKGPRIINIDSQVPNKVFHEWLGKSELFQDLNLIKPEFKYGNSRLDFYMESDFRRILVEVKGVTLEEKGVALFPDAPTDRGIKHLSHLCHSLEQGYDAYLFFIIQMKDVRYFAPNHKTHPAFGQALINAQQQGVKILALYCQVEADSIQARKWVEVRMDHKMKEEKDGLVSG